MINIKFTRRQYLNKECTHHEYYSQFVTTITWISLTGRISAERIKASTDPNFNDIPLAIWDSLPKHPPAVTEALRDCGDVPVKAGHVCIYKAAALQIKNSN